MEIATTLTKSYEYLTDNFAQQRLECINIKLLFTDRIQSMADGNVFTCVCHSLCSRGAPS